MSGAKFRGRSVGGEVSGRSVGDEMPTIMLKNVWKLEKR